MTADAQRPRLSLAVWSVPTTVAAGERFPVKAGAKSSAGCDLRGRSIEVCDASDYVLATGELGATPWPGAKGLVWTELQIAAPQEHGLLSLSARLNGAKLVPPHGNGAWHFTTTVMPPSAHTVTIEVVARETGKPLSGAEIRVGPYRAATAADGRAALHLAKGEYDLCMWKVGFDAPATPLHVNSDKVVRIEAVTVPEENVDRAWKG